MRTVEKWSEKWADAGREILELTNKLKAREADVAVLARTLVSLREACTEAYKSGRVDALAVVEAGNVLADIPAQSSRLLERVRLLEKIIGNALLEAKGAIQGDSDLVQVIKALEQVRAFDAGED